MIKINLLPRKTRKPLHRYKTYILLLFFVVNICAMSGIYYGNTRSISHYRSAIENAKKEIAALDAVYREYLKIEKEKKEIHARIKAIEGLKAGRALSARAIYDLSMFVKERVWIKNFKKNNDVFEIEGRSVENESISELVESMSSIPYLKNIELKKVEDATEEGLVVKKFSIQGNIGL